MSTKEANRLAVMVQVKDGLLSQTQAAHKLGLSTRQIKRLYRSLRQHGEAGLISKRRGLPSNRKIAPELQAQMLALIRERYSDFGPELAREHLARDHGFKHSTETLRGWMIDAGIWKAKQRRAKRVHSPRERRACSGELVQIDGSHHDWFEGRSTKCCLLAFIDDATGHVLGARFDATETSRGYLDVLERYVSQHGAPLALYSDRHSIFTKHDDEDTLPTQFERALMQLEIEPICARTPQAKGRVERLFQTLQDRMIKAMRLEGINNMTQANAWLSGYLRQHNERFGVPAREDVDMHRPWTRPPQELARICTLHHQRQLSAQGNCRFEGAILQVHPGQAQAPKARAAIDIAQYADGRLELSYRGHILTHSAYAVDTARSKVCDDKTVNSKVDAVRDKERSRMASLVASIRHQDSQRKAGIYKPDSPPNALSISPRPAPP